MKNNYIRFAAIVILLFLVSCSRDLSYQDALKKNQARFDDPKMVEDANFLVLAKSLNMLEMQLTQLASDTAYASVVVDLGRQNLKDEEELSKDIDRLARQRKIRLPNKMSVEHQQIYNDVSGSDREDFDQKFIHALKRINDAGNQNYTRMATDAYDADVRAFAARNLDILRAHEERIQNTENQLLSTYKNKY